MKKYIGISLLSIVAIAIALLPIKPTVSTINPTNNLIEDNYEDDMEKAMQQEALMTQDPALGYVPTDRIIRAKQQTTQIFNARQTLYQSQALQWNERGPSNVAGRVRALFIDKRDATGNTVFAASVSGGIWKATNFKTNPTWIPLGDNLSNMAICALAQDPTNQNIMYAGTGEGWFNTGSVRGNGIYKSVDGGQSWLPLDSTLISRRRDFEFVNDIVVTNNGIVFAACRSATFCNNGGVLRSVDGGNTWSRVIGTFPAGSTTCNDALNYRAADLEIAANGDLYATTGFNSNVANNTGRIWKATAASGGTLGAWADITPAATAGTWSRIDIACAPSNANILVALIAGNDNAIKAIQRSVDGGSTWQSLAIPSWCDQGVNKTDFTRGQAWYDLIVAIDPTNPNNFIIGGVDMLQTTNGGSSFTQISQWASGCTGSSVHADIHNIIYYPNSTEAIASTDGGLYYSTNGTTFANRNTGLNITQFYSLALHPSGGSNFMLAGAQDNGTHKFNSTDVNATTPVLSGDGGFCFIDQDNPTIQIGSFTNASYRVSRDGGVTFPQSSANSSAGRFINPTVYDDAANIIYNALGADQLGLIRNIDAGSLTAAQIPISQLNGNQISAIKVDPNIPNRVWIAGSTSSSSNTSTIPIMVLVENANSASPSITPFALPSTIVAGGYISSIDVEKGNANHLLITLSNYGVASVYESIDGGATWAAIEGNLPDMPVRWGMFLPEGVILTTGAVKGIILATETGVWTTSLSNAANTIWVPNNGGMSAVSSHMLRYRPADRTLGVATHGRGIYTTTLTLATTAVNNVAKNYEFIQQVYPTLADNIIQYKTGKALGIRQINIIVYDINGKLVLQKTAPFKTDNFTIAQLPSGTYIVKFESDNRKYRFVEKIIKK
jgi:hypothetical protein